MAAIVAVLAVRVVAVLFCVDVSLRHSGDARGIQRRASYSRLERRKLSSSDSVVSMNNIPELVAVCEMRTTGSVYQPSPQYKQHQR